MKRGDMLNKMLVLVATKFDGKFDKSGVPYTLHCLKVMHYLRSEDEELQCIALGHDLVEDTDVTYHLLREMGFTVRVIVGITAMTKVPGETNEEYVERLKACLDACKVKLADLRHNSDIRRLKGITEKDTKRLIKYNAMYMELKEHLENQ
jgi:guanosine-3',5'-bis(diphosphate) 3'-pyrophosphohydrolase